MRVLIIKLTSMGDLMHAFPALTDAANQFPGISFDWVVDEGFAEVPRWHPRVCNIITTAHRRWKKRLWFYWRSGEFQSFYRELNRYDYDVVVDLQSNLKSAVVSWLRRGVIHGYDKKSCREKPAYWAYTQQYSVALRQHAIERQRDLLSKVLRYNKPETLPDYGVDLSACTLPSIPLAEKYVVFVHNASWPSKLWPLKSWQQLVEKVVSIGYQVLLPCGSDDEHQRAQTIASIHSDAVALPKMCLDSMAAIMSKAQAVVASDTGLAHMAAVTATPAITLYAVTETLLIGTSGKGQQHIVAAGGLDKASMTNISVDTVWQKLLPLLSIGNH